MNCWIVILKFKILLLLFFIFFCGLETEDTSLRSPKNGKIQNKSELFPYIEFTVKNDEIDTDEKKILHGYIIYYKKHNENEKRICKILNLDSVYKFGIGGSDVDLSIQKTKIFYVSTVTDNNNSTINITWVNGGKFFDSERIIRAYFHDFSLINNSVNITDSGFQPAHPWYDSGTGKNVYIDNLFPDIDDKAYDRDIINFKGFLDQQYFDNITGNADKYKITFYASAYGYDQFQDKFIESDQLFIGTINFYEAYLIYQ